MPVPSVVPAVPAAAIRSDVLRKNRHQHWGWQFGLQYEASQFSRLDDASPSAQGEESPSDVLLTYATLRGVDAVAEWRSAAGGAWEAVGNDQSLMTSVGGGRYMELVRASTSDETLVNAIETAFRKGAVAAQKALSITGSSSDLIETAVRGTAAALMRFQIARKAAPDRPKQPSKTDFQHELSRRVGSWQNHVGVMRDLFPYTKLSPREYARSRVSFADAMSQVVDECRTMGRAYAAAAVVGSARTELDAEIRRQVIESPSDLTPLKMLREEIGQLQSGLFRDARGMVALGFDSQTFSYPDDSSFFKAAADAFVDGRDTELHRRKRMGEEVNLESLAGISDYCVRSTPVERTSVAALETYYRGVLSGLERALSKELAELGLQVTATGWENAQEELRVVFRDSDGAYAGLGGLIIEGPNETGLEVASLQRSQFIHQSGRIHRVGTNGWEFCHISTWRDNSQDSRQWHRSKSDHQIIEYIGEQLTAGGSLPIGPLAGKVVFQKHFGRAWSEVRAVADGRDVNVSRSVDGTETYAFTARGGRYVEVSLHPRSNWSIRIDGHVVERRNRGKTIEGTLKTHLGLWGKKLERDFGDRSSLHW